MRYYAEWLDGEYVLLNQMIRGYDHFAVMQRAIRFHALFGSSIVLSDIQMLDFRTPIPTLFLDPGFKNFLKERRDFLALVADPVSGASNQQFAIAMKGIERITNQANKPEDSFEMAVTQLGEPIFRTGYFDAKKYLDPGNKKKGHVGRVIRRFPRYSRELKGLLHAVDFFAKGSLATTTTRPVGLTERYDTLLVNAQKDHRLVSEPQALRIEQILRIQQEQLPDAQHGRRAAIRKVLGTGKWHEENWTPEYLRLYLDVVHAWNCAINRRIAPEGGTLYEAGDDLPLSRYERSVTDKVGWFRGGLRPFEGLPEPIRRFLAWDPMDSDWEHITSIVRATRDSAEKLQASSIEDRGHALAHHAEKIAEHLVKVQPTEVSQWVWWIGKAFAEVTNVFDSEWIDIAEETTREAPYAFSAMQRRWVVNTLANAGTGILSQKVARPF